MPDVLWCEGLVHISPHWTCNRNHQEVIRRRPNPQAENLYGSKPYSKSPRVLSEEYLLHIQGQVLWTNRRCSYGISHQPIVANLFMEDLETRAIQSAQNPPSFWRRFVDDTLTIMQSSQIDNFLQHLNSLDQHIQFTKEEARPDGSMPFLDVLITPREDGSLETTVYRKPTHTDLYLQWESKHTLTSKYGVVGTLHHRAQQICSSPELLQQEEKHLHQALTNCKYPEWALNKANLRSKARKTRTIRKNTVNNNNSSSLKPYMVVPYHKGVSESLKNTCSKHGIQVYFKGGRTIKKPPDGPQG